MHGMVCVDSEGGSLAHGHQQIAFGSVMPARVQDNWRFEQEQGEPFSAYLLRENPAECVVRDYGPAVLLVPYFMRRPYDMMLLLKASERRHLFELSEDELAAVAQGWRDATAAIHWIMPQLGRELAYNVITHSGPGAGLYFEFLPYTQETGGFEHLGLYVCQGNPAEAATHLRQHVNLREVAGTTPLGGIFAATSRRLMTQGHEGEITQ